MDKEEKHKLGWLEKGFFLIVAIISIYIVYFKLGLWDYRKTISWKDGEYNPRPAKQVAGIDDKITPEKPPIIDEKPDKMGDLSSFYKKFRGEGTSLNLGVGLYDLTENGQMSKTVQDFNKTCMSIRVNPKHKIRVYTHTSFQGNYADFYYTQDTKGLYDLDSKFAQKISSIEIIASNQTFIPISSIYTEDNYGGFLMLLREGSYNADSLYAFGSTTVREAKKMFNSLRVSSKHKIRVYELPDYQGSYLDFVSGNYPSFEKYKFNDLIQSIQIVGI